MNANAAVAANLSAVLDDLGGIPVSRICVDPTPGHATIEDLVRLNSQGGMFELVDATLVEKATRWRSAGLDGRSDRAHRRRIYRHHAV